MSASANVAGTDAAIAMPWRAYLVEARLEFLRVLRTPAFAVPTLLFPPLFYLLFGLLLNHGSAGAAQYLFHFSLASRWPRPHRASRSGDGSAAAAPVRPSPRRRPASA